MSLRARLTATVLALAAAGMLVLGAVTYATQRNFQYERIDDQTAAAVPAVNRALEDQGSTIPGASSRGPGQQGGGGGPRGGPGGGPDPAAANLPPGTYGERRDATGRVVGDPVVLSYGQEDLPAPDLPDVLQPNQLLTVDAQGDSGLEYRVRTTRAFGGSGMTVVAIPLEGVHDSLSNLLLVEGIVIAGVLLTLGVASWALVGVGLRPLARMGRTADAIAAGDLSRRVDEASPKTEAGRLGLALNAMLGRLERSFSEQEASEARLRQFLSDASHELRTPLASIRGYAELFRMGAADSPEESAKAMRRIEEEAARMGVLVEDLLTLARLDELRDTAGEDVDLAGLARDAVADARAMDPDREITAYAREEAVIVGDPHQLRQVLANLVRNALVHTPAGTPIEVTAVRHDGEVAVEVRDHGRGLPDGEADALFERFWRAEAGRERGRAGAGLGLAIVAGIVQAHGGTVHARNAEGGGASFVVRLPLAPPDGTESR